jgi:hypothetical protein
MTPAQPTPPAPPQDAATWPAEPPSPAGPTPVTANVAATVPVAVVDHLRRVPERPLWIAAGLALLALVAGGTGVATWVNVTRHSVAQTSTYAADVVDLRSLGSQDVTVIGSDRTDIIVTVQVTWSGSPDSPPVSAGQVTGGILSLDNPCLGTRWPCWADYRVEAPRATAVRWTAGSGDLSVTSVASLVGQGGSSDVTVRDVPKVEVTTSSGDVDVCRVSTSLSIRTSSGDVDACEVRTEAATVQTSSGDVRVDGAPARLTVDTTSGDVVLTLGADQRYDVRTSTATGDVSVKATTDRSSSRVVQVTTKTGDITVR